MFDSYTTPFHSHAHVCTLIASTPFLTRELRACARASYRYDVGNSIRSLDWSIPVNFFLILGF